MCPYIHPSIHYWFSNHVLNSVSAPALEELTVLSGSVYRKEQGTCGHSALSTVRAVVLQVCLQRQLGSCWKCRFSAPLDYLKQRF